MNKSLQELEQVSGIMRENALQKHRANVAEHDALRFETAQIDAMRKASTRQAASPAQHVAGADALWQSWLVQRRTELLQKTALARAVENDSLRHAQHAFARHRAVELLMEEDRLDRRARKLSADAAAVENLYLLNAQNRLK